MEKKNPMAKELIHFISERKKAIARVAASRVRKMTPEENRVKAAILRERFEALLDGMKLWLARGDFENWLASLDSHALKLVRKGIPIGRAFRRLRVVETAFLEDLAKWHGPESPSYPRHVQIANRFFSLFTQSFADTYEKHENRLLRDERMRRAASEKETEEKQHTLEAVFENAPVGISFVDTQGILRMTNKAFLKNLGFDISRREAIIGTRIKDQFDHIREIHTKPEKLAAFWDKIDKNPKIVFEDEFLLKDKRTIVVSGAPVQSGANEFLGRITLNRDLTHERELESLRESLTQMIVHDLKNPLTAIAGASGLLKLQIPEDADRLIKEPLKIVARNATTMMAMIVNLLDISRMEENKLKLTYQRLEIFDFLEEIRPTLEALARQRTLTFPRRRKLPVLHADPGVLQRIIENIAGNAAKHTRPGGRISIGLRRESTQWLQIAISDNGEGIAKKDQAGIFEKFGQAAGRKRGLKTDTGLGLTFCKLAVETHGGSLRLTSEKGKGSTFTIRLPFKHQ